MRLTSVAGDGYNDNLGSLEACGNDEWCCQVDVEEGNCNCYEGVGVFSLSPGKAQTIIGIDGLSLTSTTFLPSSTPPFISSISSAAASTLQSSSFQQTHTTSLASQTSQHSSTRDTYPSASWSDTAAASTPLSTTSHRSTSSERHASTLHSTSEQSKSSKSGSASTSTAQATPALTSTNAPSDAPTSAPTDTPTETSASSSSSPTNSNVTAAASPSYLSTHKTGVGLGITFGAIAALALILSFFCCRNAAWALILGIFCCRDCRKRPARARIYQRTVSPSEILGPPNPDFSDIPPLSTPYNRPSNANINRAAQTVSTLARAPGSSHLDLLPNPHPYQRSNNNSSNLAYSNTSNPAFRGNPYAPPSSTQSSVPLLNTNNPGSSQVGYYGELPTPHPYSPQEALREQSAPLIPPTRSHGPTDGPSTNQPYTIFHTAAGSLAQSIGTPPPRYSPRRPNRSVPVWSPESVGTGSPRVQ